MDGSWRRSFAPRLRGRWNVRSSKVIPPVFVSAIVLYRKHITSLAAIIHCKNKLDVASTQKSPSGQLQSIMTLASIDKLPSPARRSKYSAPSSWPFNVRVWDRSHARKRDYCSVWMRARTISRLCNIDDLLERLGVQYRVSRWPRSHTNPSRRCSVKIPRVEHGEVSGADSGVADIVLLPPFSWRRGSRYRAGSDEVALIVTPPRGLNLEPPNFQKLTDLLAAPGYFHTPTFVDTQCAGGVRHDNALSVYP